MRTLLLNILLLLSMATYGQATYGMENGDRNSRKLNRLGSSPSRSDSIDSKSIPFGIYTWKIDERFGTRYFCEPDTAMSMFPQQAFTEGPRGEYNHTGNYGSARVARIYNGQNDYMMGSQFLFAKPFDYFLVDPGELLYTNTKSPFTNITYNSCGNKMTGEDRITAQFCVNAGKKLGIGFRLDYLYGHGYYQNQGTSEFGGIVYGSYMSERYEMHLSYGANHLKNVENGGLDNDMYITDKELLPTKYNASDMPVRLDQTWNRQNVNTCYLTHRYNMGSYVTYKVDTVLVGNDSLQLQERKRFVPIASAIHTMQIGHHNHAFKSYLPNDQYFADAFFLANDSADDKTRNISVQNTLALEMREGFRKWVKTGMRLFAKHDLEHFTLLDAPRHFTSYNENYFTVGAQLLAEQGRVFTYHALGELRTTGKDWGEFNVEGDIHFNIPIKRDSVQVKAYGYVRNEQPSFYYRHYHGRNAWWDREDYKNIFRTRIGGELQWRTTKVSVAMETVQNHTYFQRHAVASYNSDGDFKAWLYGVAPAQATHNVQVLSASLEHGFKFGPFHWDIAATYQQSSDQSVLPLPTFTGYTNMFFKFRIAHVLSTELGADAHYFTRYYAPDYDPSIGMYANQAEESKVKIGNYPWINAYVNFHLKRCRIYVMYSHVNCKSGNYFLVPHHPTNGRTFHFGISWNFIN